MPDDNEIHLLSDHFLDSYLSSSVVGFDGPVGVVGQDKRRIDLGKSFGILA